MEKKEISFFYVSAKEYAGRTGLGYRDVLHQCEKGFFDCFMTEGGQWRIKVLKNENNKELERLKEENAALRNAVSNVIYILEGVLTYTESCGSEKQALKAPIDVRRT